MPWKQTCPMDEKIKFVAAVNTHQSSFAEVCREFGISRKSGYVLMRRYEQEGLRGLLARSRAPHTHPNAMDEAMAEQLLQIKQRYPRLGPGKVLDRMCMQGHEREQLPARSSVGDLFKRHGLVRRRKPRAARAARSAPLNHAQTPNALWSVDFKGQFRLGNGRWCYPLTVSDNASRYLLVCRGMEHPTERGVWPHMELAFREFGLPRAMRSDNGSPFASSGLAGLTKLSVWWLKLGIGLERIMPGHPEQNARHERIHRTLSEDIEQPRHDLAAQQRRLNWFQHYYNEERPHDALHGVPPARCYSGSPRPYPRRVCTPEYPVGFTVRQGAQQRSDQVAGAYGVCGSGTHRGAHRVVASHRRRLASVVLPSESGFAQRAQEQNRATNLNGKSVTYVPGLKCHLSARLHREG